MRNEYSKFDVERCLLDSKEIWCLMFRCRTYDTVPAGCTLRTDPKDSCCVAPDCNNPNILNPTPQPTPSPGPNGITLNPQVNPSTSGVIIYPSPVPTGSFIGSGIVPGTGSSYPGTLITGNTS